LIFPNRAAQQRLDRIPDFQKSSADITPQNSGRVARIGLRFRRQQSRCRGVRRGETFHRSLLDDLAAFMTQTTSAMRPNDAEIMGDEHRLMPSRARNLASSVRICACTVTSSAVVGSSAISRSGSLASAHRDHHALALATGQLGRIVAKPRFGSGMPTWSRAQRPRPRHGPTNSA